MATAQPLTFGHLLKRYRLAAGLTQEELAARAGLGVRSISDLERGVRRTPYRDTVALLAEALGLSAAVRTAFEATARGQGTAWPHQSPAGGAETSSRAVLLPPLVGRAREVALIGRHLAGEGPPLLLLAGEPGIGKTRLLREAAQLAQTAGWSVLASGCTRRGSQQPYAPLLQALAGRLLGQRTARLRAELEGCAWLVRLLPELTETTLVPAPAWSLPPEQERRLMFAAVGRFLANMAGPAGTLLLLDDLQWAGADAFDLLATLVRSEPERPVRVVGVYRSTEVRPADPLGSLLADLAREGLATQRTLGPLPLAEAAHLLQLLLEDSATEEGAAEDLALRERVLERSGGVPYFLVSCAQALRAGALAEDTGIGGEAVPWDVAQTIHQRVAALPASAQELLAAAAVAGRVVPGALLVAVAGHPEDAVLVALEAACQAGLLIEDEEDVYQFAHDLIREVVVAALSTRRRKVLHRRVAEALEQGPGDPAVELLAYHYVRAGMDDKAILYLERAGDRARALYAHAEAERYYHDLVERLDRLGHTTKAAGAREKLGRVLMSLAQFDQAVDTLERAAAAYRAAGNLEGCVQAVTCVVRVHSLRGDPGMAITRLQQESSDLAGLSPRSRAYLYAALMYPLHNTGRYAEALLAAEQASEYARSAQEHALLLRTEMRRGYTLGTLGRLEEARRVLEEVLLLAQMPSGSLEILCYTLNHLSVTCTSLGNYEQSMRYAEHALQVAGRLGSPDIVLLTHSNCGWSAYLLGEWRRARAELEGAVALARHMETGWATPYPLLNLGILCRSQGQPEIAASLIEEGSALAERSEDLQLVRWLQQELAEGDLLAGRPDAARARLEPLHDLPGGDGIDAVSLFPFLAWAYLELGDIERAEEAVAQGLSRASVMQLRPAIGDALRIQSTIAIRQEHWADAEGALDEALTLARAMPYPYAEAKALYVYGQLHVAKGEPERARERFEAALAILNRLGERLYAAHIERAIEAIK